MMYDAVIIGAGPGGYVCAIEISKLGGKVCIVEKNGFGGTCTQRGCIPTKYLHSVGDFVRKASTSKSYGIDSKIDLDYKILKSKMFTVLKVPKEKISDKAIEDVKQRVFGIGKKFEFVASAMKDSASETFSADLSFEDITEKEERQRQTLDSEKYSSKEWNFKR